MAHETRTIRRFLHKVDGLLDKNVFFQVALQEGGGGVELLHRHAFLSRQSHEELERGALSWAVAA